MLNIWVWHTFPTISPLSQAAEEFEKIARARPDDEEVPKVLAQLWHTLGHPDRGIQALELFLQRKVSHLMSYA